MKKGSPVGETPALPFAAPGRPAAPEQKARRPLWAGGLFIGRRQTDYPSHGWRSFLELPAQARVEDVVGVLPPRRPTTALYRKTVPP